jgi:hypothetical protein
LLQQNKNEKKGTITTVPFCLPKKPEEEGDGSKLLPFFAMLHQKIKLKEGKKAYLEAWNWKLKFWRSHSHFDFGTPAPALAMVIEGRRGEVGGR